MFLKQLIIVAFPPDCAEGYFNPQQNATHCNSQCPAGSYVTDSADDDGHVPLLVHLFVETSSVPLDHQTVLACIKREPTVWHALVVAQQPRPEARHVPYVQRAGRVTTSERRVKSADQGNILILV